MALPNQWEICDFPKTLVKNRVGRNYQIDSSKIKVRGKYPVVDQGQDYIAGYSDETDKVYTPGQPVIVFGDHTRCFKYVDFPFVVGADGTKILTPNTKLFNPKFYYFYLLSIKIQSRGYNRHFKLLKEQKMVRPPLVEQQNIAHILSTIQSGIETQEKVIKATTELKKALMQKLFTEGLHGEPQKETEIGLVPESWQVMSIESVCEHPQYGFTDTASKSGSTKYLRITDIDEFGVDWDTVPYCNCPASAIDKYLLRTNDIVVARIGATTGKTFIVKSPPHSVFASYLIRLRPKPALDADYLFYFSNTEIYWRQINANKATSLKKGVNGSILKTLLLPYPPIDTQRAIAKALQQTDKKIVMASQKRDILQSLFKSMLHHLMTGQIRVKDIKFS